MIRRVLSSLAGLLAVVSLSAQTLPQEPRLTVGGYGEAAFSANFYSDNVYRYSSAASHAGERHSRVDIPHAVIYLGYDFGHGWTMQTEIEFEHTGTGAAVEKEFEEAGEWETEIEKGGEVELEQFWIQKPQKPTGACPIIGTLQEIEAETSIGETMSLCPWLLATTMFRSDT